MTPFESIHLYDLIILCQFYNFLESCYHNIPSILLIDKNVQKIEKVLKYSKKIL